MSVYKLTGTTVQDNVASLDIIAAGHIVGMVWNMVADLDADGDRMELELSFASTSGFTSNDTRASLSGVGASNGLLTSGAINGAATLAIPVPRGVIPVLAGERLYLHSKGTAGALGQASVWIYVDDGMEPDVSRPSRRRV